MKNFKKFIYSLLILSIFILPAISLAQYTGGPGGGSASSNVVSSSCSFPASPTFGTFVDFITCNINKSILPLLFTLAFAAFVWGIVQYVILGAEEEAKREKGRQFMIWGIIALAVMISVWGIVNIFTNTFGIKNTSVPIIPQLPTH